MQLFYSSLVDINASHFTFDKIESRHIVKVLRKNENDKILITNGKGNLITAKIIIANDKKCNVEIVNVESKIKSWNYYLHVAIAPTKNNDRLEWFLEKATEIGIDEITPIICDHSERKTIKEERLSKVITSAMKQSLKYQLPKLNSAMSFIDFLKQSFQGQLFIAHCEDSSKKPLKVELNAKQKITILIGPEGDFSTDEIKHAINNKFIPVSLGENRLRTETAALVAVQSVSFFNE